MIIAEFHVFGRIVVINNIDLNKFIKMKEKIQINGCEGLLTVLKVLIIFNNF